MNNPRETHESESEASQDDSSYPDDGHRRQPPGMEDHPDDVTFDDWALI